MKDGPTIVVVDDDLRSLRLMDALLSQRGFNVVKAANGEEAIAAVAKSVPALVLMDVMMPVMDGFTACKRIREFSRARVIMVTARGDTASAVAGFEVGADDYVAKPFSGEELVARIRAVLRRAQYPAEPVRGTSFRLKDLTIDLFTNHVTLGNREVNVTPTEFRMLAYLAENAGRILKPGEILSRVWGDEYRDETHLLQVTVSRLRAKLGEDNKNPRYIATRHSVGYWMPKQ